MMKKIKAVLLAVLIPATLVAGTPKMPDLSSPEKALETYLSFMAKGGTMAGLMSLSSKENYEVCFAGEDAAEIKSQMNDAVQPEDRFAKVTTDKKEVTGNRAIFQLKVKYTDEWLKKDEAESKQEKRKNVIIPAASDPNPGEFAEYPCHINGEGYVSFLFVKQGDSWRFHKSHASRTPSDFTALLKEASLLPRSMTSKTAASPKQQTIGNRPQNTPPDRTR